MKKRLLGMLTILATVVATTTFSQSAKAPSVATFVTAEEIENVGKTPPAGDREIKILDMGRYNLGVAVVRRDALKSGGPIIAINHTKLTEVYHVISGEGTMVTGGQVKDIKPLASDSELVTTIVGPSNNAIFVKPADSRKVKTGDVIVIPAGVYHGFSEVPDHIEYVLIRPDVNKVLPGGYINPALKP